VHRLALTALLVVTAGSAHAADIHEFLGAERCGTCHAPQLQAWKEGPHANALRSLTPRQARDPACASCHNMAPEGPPELRGVQCESCHGPGRSYAAEAVMRDEVLSKLMGLQPITPQTCAQCHRGSAPGLRDFSYGEAIRRVCTNRLPHTAEAPPSR
jgi:nitrate/TMAO reductase-like tetraheme cytochrome c subunit